MDWDEAQHGAAVEAAETIELFADGEVTGLVETTCIAAGDLSVALRKRGMTDRQLTGFIVGAVIGACLSC